MCWEHFINDTEKGFPVEQMALVVLTKLFI